VMAAAGVAAAASLPVARVPCVIKADGLASGKGVFVCRTPDELEAGLRGATALDPGGALVIEELLEGREASVFALCDGTHAIPLGAAQDYKRAGDGDQGPNTGGMGAYSPVSSLDAAELVRRVHQPVVDELARRGTPFVGCLFAGLMLTADGPRILEFNARLGDPETQVLLPRLEGDLLEALAGAARGRMGEGLRESADSAVTVVLTGPEYPARSDYAGAAIEGLADAEASGAIVFHGGTAVRDGRIVTNGGRILSVTAVAPGLEEARRQAYEAVDKVRFDGVRFRTDIAAVTSG
jgi:phosphoribosylamine--glycine ligase